MPATDGWRVLILGGTREAAELARRVHEAGEVAAITSLAGRLPNPALPPGEVRIGGFGGAVGLADYLEAEGIAAVIDATHPFAATISAHAQLACEGRGVPRLVLRRPSWRPAPGDRWYVVDDLEGAAALLPTVARRAFLTTGSGGLEAFSAVPNVWFLVRLIAPRSPLPIPGAALVTGRPPFTLDRERRLIAARRIDTLVTKNSGGAAEAKLDAAREAGIQVIMIRRPPPPPGETVETVTQALRWLTR